MILHLKRRTFKNVTRIKKKNSTDEGWSKSTSRSDQGQIRILSSGFRKAGIQPKAITFMNSSEKLIKQKEDTSFSAPVNIENKKRAQERKKARELAKLNKVEEDMRNECFIPAFVPDDDFAQKERERIEAIHRRDSIFAITDQNVHTFSNRSGVQIVCVPDEDQNVNKNRKRHKLYWASILHILEATQYETVSADSFYNACFLHALFKEKIKLKKIKKYMRSSCKLLKDNPEKFTNKSRSVEEIHSLIKELDSWLSDVPTKPLPECLWSPEPLVQAMAQTLQCFILYITPWTNFRGTLKNDQVVICERYDPKGGYTLMTDQNADEILLNKLNCDLRLLFFPGGKHWHYIDYK